MVRYSPKRVISSSLSVGEEFVRAVHQASLASPILCINDPFYKSFPHNRHFFFRYFVLTELINPSSQATWICNLSRKIKQTVF